MSSERRSRRGSRSPTVGATRSPARAVTVTGCPAWPRVIQSESAISVSTPFGKNYAVTSRKLSSIATMSPPYLLEAVGASGTGAVVVIFRSSWRRRGRARPFIPGVRPIVRRSREPDDNAERWHPSGTPVARRARAATGPGCHRAGVARARRPPGVRRRCIRR